MVHLYQVCEIAQIVITRCYHEKGWTMPAVQDKMNSAFLDSMLVSGGPDHTIYLPVEHRVTPKAKKIRDERTTPERPSRHAKTQAMANLSGMVYEIEDNE
jgi:hypothetical protein